MFVVGFTEGSHTKRQPESNANNNTVSMQVCRMETDVFAIQIFWNGFPAMEWTRNALQRRYFVRKLVKNNAQMQPCLPQPTQSAVFLSPLKSLGWKKTNKYTTVYEIKRKINSVSLRTKYYWQRRDCKKKVRNVSTRNSNRKTEINHFSIRNRIDFRVIFGK